MTVELRLPALAEGADSGTVVSVQVTPGSRIEKGQTILELENQKAIAPVPSTASGQVVKVHVKQGDLITVGQVLVTVEAEEGAGGVAPPAHGPAARLPSAGALGARPADRPYRSPAGAPPPISPSLRKMARELGIDLAKVPGSERGGRITAEDLRGHVARLQQAGERKSPSGPPVDFSRWGPIRREKFSSLRQSVARAMQESWESIPHVTQLDEADATPIWGMMQKHAPAFQKGGVKLTLTVFLLRALAQVLKKHPIFNCSLDESAGELVHKEYVHIGIAVDTEAGLIVPVLRDVDKKGMRQLAKELEELAERTRQRKVTLEELHGASFTLSNQGGIGGTHFTPIIHKPEVAVLGVGRAVIRPVYVKEGSPPEPRRILPLAVSYDHRVIDGAQAARFIRDLVQALETFPEPELER